MIGGIDLGSITFACKPHHINRGTIALRWSLIKIFRIMVNTFVNDKNHFKSLKDIYWLNEHWDQSVIMGG